MDRKQRRPGCRKSQEDCNKSGELLLRARTFAAFHCTCHFTHSHYHWRGASSCLGPSLPRLLLWRAWWGYTRYPSISISTSRHFSSILGRDADRRKKTGWRRWIVTKEDLVAEERRPKKSWWAPVQGPTLYLLVRKRPLSIRNAKISTPGAPQRSGRLQVQTSSVSGYLTTGLLMSLLLAILDIGMKLWSV